MLAINPNLYLVVTCNLAVSWQQRAKEMDRGGLINNCVDGNSLFLKAPILVDWMHTSPMVRATIQWYSHIGHFLSYVHGEHPIYIMVAMLSMEEEYCRRLEKSDQKPRGPMNVRQTSSKSFLAVRPVSYVAISWLRVPPIWTHAWSCWWARVHSQARS